MTTCLAADAAEARGDAEQALDLMASKPLDPRGRPFWRPDRVARLRQLSELRPVVPAWAVSRWLLALALQDLVHTDRDRVQRALAEAIDARGGRPLPGVDAVDAQCRVVDRDWIYRQLRLYEHGGLDAYLRHAIPDVVAGADRIRDWAAAPMRALSLVAQSSHTVTWHDVSTAERVVTLNTGCAALVLPGEHVIGRVVPIESGSMFETAPLRVPEAVSSRVADDPSGWVAAITEQNRDSGLEPVKAYGFGGFGILSDVPRLVWRQAALDAAEVLSTARRRFPRRRDVDPQALTLIAAALDPAMHAGFDSLTPDRVHPWACVVGALVEPGVASYLATQFEPSDAQDLLTLGARLAEPGGDLCRWLAEGLSRAA